MGKREAIVDGIEFYYDRNCPRGGRMGCTVYLVPCSRCGHIIRSNNYGRNKEYICDMCRLGEKRKQDAIAESWLQEIETKGERRFNAALDEIEAQVKDFSKYESAISIARLGREKYGSIPEAMVAIELIRLGYKIIPQQQVGKYRVDFFVPEQKFVVEVDGDLYHKNNRKSDREATVQFSLGLDVKIIHVSAELIRKNIQKLGKYISKSLELP